MPWPPRPSDLAESAMNVPKELDSLLQILMTGKKEWPDEDCHPRVQRLMKSFAQDLMFGVSRRKSEPPKQIQCLRWKKKDNSPTTCEAAYILPRNVQAAGYGMGSIRYAFSKPPSFYM